MPVNKMHPSATPLDWPPPLHDPRERALVALVDGWEVRVFPPCDRKFHYFVTRGFLHAQLWHRGACVSVLTPSRLTNGLFEVFPYAGWKAPAREPALLRSLVAQTHGVALPSLRRLASIVEWYVCAEERRALRGPPAQAATAQRRTRSDHSSVPTQSNTKTRET